MAGQDQEWANEEQPEWADEKYAKNRGSMPGANPSKETAGQGKGKTKEGKKKKGVGFEALANRTKYNMDLAGETKSFYTEEKGEQRMTMRQWVY